jgi:hypothetical protein
MRGVDSAKNLHHGRGGFLRGTYPELKEEILHFVQDDRLAKVSG